jgi:hypothetical protein
MTWPTVHCALCPNFVVSTGEIIDKAIRCNSDPEQIKLLRKAFIEKLLHHATLHIKREVELLVERAPGGKLYGVRKNVKIFGFWNKDFRNCSVDELRMILTTIDDTKIKSLFTCVYTLLMKIDAKCILTTVC